GGGECNDSFCPHWTALDTNSNTAEIAASGTKLFQRHTNGVIWEFTGVPCSELIPSKCPGWRKLDNNPRTVQIVSGGGHLYQMWQNGTIFRFTGAACSGDSCLG